jgi:PKD repeat protein
MVERISSLDDGYEVGDLSIYPEGIDSKDTLYDAKNNAETVLTQTLSYSGQKIVVNDASKFPSQGLLRVGLELIYYAARTNTVFSDLKRGFAGSRQNIWPINTKIAHTVQAEPHNAVKDAVINIENNLGTIEDPEPESLNGILKELESRFLAPKPLFRGFPLVGPPPLKVKFQNFTDGPAVRFLWDFGDGTTSADLTPVHTYQNEGFYTVKLSVITSLGAQGIITKTDYVRADSQEKLPFFYAVTVAGISSKTAQEEMLTATTFDFVDQTDGDIVARYWIWGDGTNTVISDPDVHTESHVYDLPGTYEPTLLVSFANTRLKRLLLGEKITVS